MYSKANYQLTVGFFYTQNDEQKGNIVEKHKELKIRSAARLGSLQGEHVTQEAQEAFRRPVYQPAHRQVHRITLIELTDAVFRLVNSQAYKMSDPVPDELLDRINGRHEGVAEFVARKYGKGGTDGEYK